MKQFFLRPLTLTMLAIFTLIIGTIAFVSLQEAPDPFEGDAITNPPFPSLSYSIQTFLWWDEGNAGAQLAMIRNVLNFSMIKQTFAWRDLEGEQGTWDFTQADRIVDSAEFYNLGIIARLGQVPAWATDGAIADGEESHDSPPNDLAAWGNYCGTLAERYQGRILAYQIWNEPNLAREWGEREPNAAEYVEILGVCSEAIRAVDSTAILISAGLSPTGTGLPIAIPDDVYLDAMYRANFQQYIDVVGVHAPGYSIPSYGPDDAEQDGRGRFFTFRRVEDLRKIMLLHDDAARQMAILEFGYTTDTQNPDYAWFSVSEEAQAQYILEAYDYAIEHWRPWIGLMNLIYMPDPRWTEADEEYWWAIQTPEGRPRPAFFAIISMDKFCNDRVVSGWYIGVSQEEWDEQRDTCP